MRAPVGLQCMVIIEDECEEEGEGRSGWLGVICHHGERGSILEKKGGSFSQTLNLMHTVP